MPYQVLFQRLSFQKTKPNEPTIPIGDPEVVVRGDLVPDYVPLFQISALENAGMIVAVSNPDPGLLPDDVLPPQYRTPDMPAVLPSDPNGTAPTLADLTPVTPGEDADNDPATPVTPVTPDAPTGPSVGALPPLPQVSDKKEVWESYAQRPQIGMTAGEAEGLTKTELITEVRKRAEGK